MKSFNEFKKDTENAIRKELPEVTEVIFSEMNVSVNGKELLKDPAYAVEEEWTKFVENDADYQEEIIMYVDMAILKIRGFQYWINQYGPEKRDLRNRMN